jgi:hypothetical protein
VASYADSPAAKLLPPAAEVGTITATFAAAWARDQFPPDDERGSAERGDDPTEALATARGEAVEQRYDVVERLVGQTRAIVSVRYAPPAP